MRASSTGTQRRCFHPAPRTTACPPLCVPPSACISGDSQVQAPGAAPPRAGDAHGASRLQPTFRESGPATSLSVLFAVTFIIARATAQTNVAEEGPQARARYLGSTWHGVLTAESSSRRARTWASSSADISPILVSSLPTLPVIGEKQQAIVRTVVKLARQPRGLVILVTSSHTGRQQSGGL